MSALLVLSEVDYPGGRTLRRLDLERGGKSGFSLKHYFLASDLIGNRFLWEGDGKQVVLVKAPD
jgi:hypothetical protein